MFLTLVYWSRPTSKARRSILGILGALVPGASLGDSPMDLRGTAMARTGRMARITTESCMMTVVVDDVVVIVEVDVWVQVYKKKRRSERESDRRRFSRSSNNTSTFRSGFTGRGKKTSQTGNRQRSHTYGRPSGLRSVTPSCPSRLPIVAHPRERPRDV
ncbi:hypothetical protein B0T11DRAFT_287450 [Plectosphaerella cucumerina]|uniref:Uncharacterized protein n=1 Tax=Plectosphaerella cucumerina TaxID=40658 RepID=A0A8K0TCF6_9PEZI|nr:hypothetical protein B0T11DRAFT_287450 [Plectosphaerella cucumerina]